MTLHLFFLCGWGLFILIRGLGYILKHWLLKHSRVGLCTRYIMLHCWKQIVISNSRNTERAIRLEIKHCEMKTFPGTKQPPEGRLIISHQVQVGETHSPRYTSQIHSLQHEGLDPLVGKGRRENIQMINYRDGVCLFPSAGL